jgi:hypothetical protein
MKSAENPIQSQTPSSTLIPNAIAGTLFIFSFVRGYLDGFSLPIEPSLSEILSFAFRIAMEKWKQSTLEMAALLIISIFLAVMLNIFFLWISKHICYLSSILISYFLPPLIVILFIRYFLEDMTLKFQFSISLFIYLISILIEKSPPPNEPNSSTSNIYWTFFWGLSLLFTSICSYNSGTMFSYTSMLPQAQLDEKKSRVSIVWFASSATFYLEHCTTDKVVKGVSNDDPAKVFFVRNLKEEHATKRFRPDCSPDYTK